MSLAMCRRGSFSKLAMANDHPLVTARLIMSWSTNSDLPEDGCPVTTVSIPGETVYSLSTLGYPVSSPLPMPRSYISSSWSKKCPLSYRPEMGHGLHSEIRVSIPSCPCFSHTSLASLHPSGYSTVQTRSLPMRRAISSAAACPGSSLSQQITMRDARSIWSLASHTKRNLPSSMGLMAPSATLITAPVGIDVAPS